jgi:D-glycero-D-manno-heptose 1,7-bisphosphate phosphatase
VSRFVFLDRDGTLVRDVGYPHRVADYALLAGVPEALTRLAAAGYRLAIVTNQSGIGRGIFGEADFQEFQSLLLGDLARAGVEIEATYHCPHAPADACRCRKPAPGLLEQAAAELGASLTESWVVGDGTRDVELAAQAGCRGAVWLHPGGRGGLAGPRPRLFAEAADLGGAVDHILAAG